MEQKCNWREAMNNHILNILCEGSTEENFVKKVLSTYLKSFGIITKVRQLTTNRKKDIRGGVSSYQKAKNDFRLWVKAGVPVKKHRQYRKYKTY